MANGMDLWIHSIGLAQPVANFEQGAKLRATLQQIDQEQAAQTFNQTMKVVEMARQSREAKDRMALQRDELSLRQSEADNRMKIAQQNLDLRTKAANAKANAPQRQFTPAGIYGADNLPADIANTPAPDVAATPLPADVPNGVAAANSDQSPSNFMAATPASGGDQQVSLLGADGAAPPSGIPQQAIPRVDDMISQNPVTRTSSPMAASPSPLGGTLTHPVQESNGMGTVTSHAVFNGVPMTRTTNERTGNTSKWTALPTPRGGASSADSIDPTEGAYTNAEGVLVKKVGDTEVPVEQITQRSKAGSITMRPPKKVDSSRVEIGPDGAGFFTDDNGVKIPVKAKGVTFANGKYSVRYDVPGSDPITSTPDEKLKNSLDFFAENGIKIKSGSINAKGEVSLHGAVPADEKPEAGTIGAMTAKWTAKAKTWRDGLIQRIYSPDVNDKVAAALDKQLSEVTPDDYKKLTPEMWSQGYSKAREGFINLLANQIEKTEGISSSKVKDAILGTIKNTNDGDGRDSENQSDEDLPPIDPTHGLNRSSSSTNILPTPSTYKPQQPPLAPVAPINKAKSFLDRVTKKPG